MQDIHLILNKYWGYNEFRPLQKEIIESVLNGKDTLAVLPTGGGKSVCFQVPALAREGICLVISPLIALMKDQVFNLKKRGIPALSIHSGMQRQDVIRTLKNATDTYFKFLYVSPERLETSLFREYLPSLNINLIAVDEAHCISQWGYDFRPSYLRIAELRKELPGVPVIALTASATPEVQDDIALQLQFSSQNIFKQSFERPNLSYSVFNVPSKTNKLLDILRNVAGSGIIYCKSRKRTGEIAQLLQMHGISALNYHAGLTADERNRRQTDWIDNKVEVIVCTNAFGMGIDKPDVRKVIHTDPPDCLENYYQEAGRAGRDGKKAYAVLLTNEKDREDLSLLQEQRFPSLDKIKQVYQALVNYLQIPVYEGENRSFIFRFDEFIHNFKLNSLEVMYSLKALEQDGWLEYNEKNFISSAVVFTTNKNSLYEFERANPGHEVLLTTILRTYEGIFDFPSFISERFLAKTLFKDEGAIIKELRLIAGFGIIHYTPKNDDPFIVFKKNRVNAADLTFNYKLYNKRKAAFNKRVEKLVSYISSTQCRSKFINLYFGDKSAMRCNTCDNCLSSNKASISSEEFDRLSKTITSIISGRQLTITGLYNEMNNVNEEKVWKVVSFLQAEEKIKASEDGLLRLTP